MHAPFSPHGVAVASREPLAVIGISCRFPGGINSAASYWDALLAGIDAIRNVPEDRWKHSRFHDAHPEKVGSIRNAKGGFIDGIECFDAEFFGYFPTEAQRLDPQQRFLLEVAYEAMEDAGLRRDQLDGSRTAVIVGSFMYDYLCIQAASEQRDEINSYVAMGTAVTSMANRISYNFNLKGPSITLDAACASSLIATHLACRSIWEGDADLALAAGVNLMLRPESSIILSRAGMLNSDQYCKTFDASANGYVRGEGAGAVLLKPLSRALADGDAIYAVVRGSAVNHNGYLPDGFTVPNVFAQISMLKTAYAEAGIDPLTVDYVEAHGTGTPVGDPLESLALGTVLGRGRPGGRRCLVGSVKTNLGHLEGASGIAGFIKAALTAQHGIVPPNLHLHEPNPGIDFDGLQLQVPTTPTPLERDSRPVTVGVNSFGAGGANAHIVLQELPATKPHGAAPGPAPARPTLYLLSAAHRDALRTLALHHAEFLHNSDERLDDVAFSAFARRSRLSNILAIVGESRGEIVKQLRAFADGQVDPAAMTATIAAPPSSTTTRWTKAKLGFVFSGQGGQWVRMGQQLMQREPVFRQTIDDVDALFHELSGWSIRAELEKPEGVAELDRTAVVQPAIMAIQVALFRLYEHYGIRPQGVVGHSIGEVAAAFAAGALTLRQAVSVIYHRSQAQLRAEGKGGMLAVGLSFDEARKLIAPYGDRLSIGAVNGPEMLTLSGDFEPLHDIAELLDARGVFNRQVRVQVPYHSHHMEPLREIMVEAMRPIVGKVATIPLYSTVTGQRETGAHLQGDYWFRNAREPVLFTDALRAMLDHGFDAFVEIGPHPVLVAGSEALFQQRKSSAVIGPAMTRRGSETVVFLQSLARLAARGIDPDTEMIFGSGRRYVRLPKYPWQHGRFWFETPSQTLARRGRFDHPFLKRATQLVTEEGLGIWEAAIQVQKFPFLRDHRVDGEVVFPATGHLDLAWAVASEQFPAGSFFLEKLQFESALILSENSRHPLDVRLEINSAQGDYQICSRPADAPAHASWVKHSSGRINSTHDRFDRPAVTPADLQSRFHDAPEVSVAAFYDTIGKAGLNYGEKFRCVQRLRLLGSELLADVQLPKSLVPESPRHFVHPALLDACLHIVFAHVHQLGGTDRVYLPFRIARVRFHRQPTSHVTAHVRVTRSDEQFVCTDTLMFDDAGELVAEVIGLDSKRLANAGARPAAQAYDGCFEYHWTPALRSADAYDRIADLTRAVLVTNVSADPHAAELATRLTDEGLKSTVLVADPRETLDDALADVPLDRRTLVAFLPGSASAAERATDRAEASGWHGLARTPAIPTLLKLTQAFHRREGVPRFAVVTCGAVGLAGDPPLDLGQATLHGMARVIRNEFPNITLTVIDAGASPQSTDMDGLVAELLTCRRDRDESEIAVRGAQRFVRQLIPVDMESAERAATTLEAGAGGDYRAEPGERGVLDQIVFRRLPPIEPGPAEVEIAVEAAGLNFKDVMNATAMLPEIAVAGGLAAERLGLEVAGKVVRAGADVTHVRAGDDVLARVADGFSGRTIAPSHCVVRRPASLSATQAAAVPFAYVTAWYALHHLARIERGETVLIHSAAGGVGSAAIRLAQLAGAVVIATAGTKDKRDYLRQLGVEHVFDSRSIDFRNHVLDATRGRGVDVVVNSLSGRYVTQSLKCLAPFGRFVELGKADVYRNRKLNLEQMAENVSYFVVDVDRLAAQRPELHRRALTEVTAMFDRRELPPPEITEFPMSQLSEALKFMSRAAYRGKIVLNAQADRVRTLPPHTAAFRPDRTYLITGGASGLGLEIAKWMVGRGARHLVLFSRSGCKRVEDAAQVEALLAQGADVRMLRGDVADADAVAEMVRRIERDLPPLAGVVHGAAVMDDAMVPNIDMMRFGRVFLPKAQGAWNLHEATTAAGCRLDFFVMLSSISSVLGFFGQVNYAAANFFQDSLAQYRRQLGLPGTAVNLGVLGQYAGLSRSVNDEQDVLALLESHGLLVMPLADVLTKLEATIVQQPVQRMTGRFDWSRYRTAYPNLARDARFLDLLSDAALARGTRSKGCNLRQMLSDLPQAQRSECLAQEIVGSLAVMLDIDPSQLEPSTSLDQLGLDSMMLSQLRNWILRSLDINLPMIKLLKGPSIITLAAELASQLSSDGPVAARRNSEEGPGFTIADVEGVEVLNPWLIRRHGLADAPLRLVCFHSMGVGASLFTRFLLDPPEDYDVIAVQTPGRENRQAEPVAEHVPELADQIVAHLLPLLDRPFVIWGHSFGGIVAAEVLRRLRTQRLPLHFVVTGTVAPHLIHVWQKREIMLKAMVADNSPEYIVSLARYVDDAEFLKSILPLMRRDFPLLRNYRFSPFAPVEVPITAFSARQDDMVYTDEVREWAPHTRAGFRLIEVDGDHWFLNRNRESIVDELREIARRAPVEPVAALTADRASDLLVPTI